MHTRIDRRGRFWYLVAIVRHTQVTLARYETHTDALAALVRLQTNKPI